MATARTTAGTAVVLTSKMPVLRRTGFFDGLPANGRRPEATTVTQLPRHLGEIGRGGRESSRRPGLRAGRRSGACAADAARGRRAFTLLELLLVLVVIGAVLALAAPSMHGFFASRQTADAALRVLALTQWCHNEAITGGHRVRLMVEEEGGAFWSWAAVERGGQFVDADGESGRRWQFPEGSTVRIRPAGGDAASLATHVEFHPGGRHEVATIEITGRQGEVQQVTCDSPTEAFRLEKPGEGGRR